MCKTVSTIVQDIDNAITKAHAVLHAYGASKRTSGVPKDKIVKLLQSSKTPATTVFLATQHLLKSDSFLAWEPESIWLELADKGVASFPQVNRDKLLAVSTIIMGDAFHYDALVFEKTMIAFNNLPIDGEAIQEASPGEIAWGVVEAQLLSSYAGHDNSQYDYEPTRYIAVSAHRDGLVLMPEIINFAQEELDKLNRGDDSNHEESLKNRVGLALAAINGDNTTYAEDEVGTQLARLAAIDAYLRRKTSQLVSEMSIFGT